MEIICTICRNYSRTLEQHEKHKATPEHEANANIYAEGMSAGEYKAQAELAALRAENAELREALEAITERAEDVSDRIVVEKRNPGVSQATHVSHMASHLAQHAKKARAILAKREWSADDILKREG